MAEKQEEKKSLIEEFKEFAVRGNVVEIAVGLVVGAAFTDLVKTFVDTILMPPIGLLLARVNFEDLYWNLSDEEYSSLSEAVEAGAPVIQYGAFITDIINFIIIAFVVFLIVKNVNRLKGEKEREDEKAAKKSKK